MELKNKTGIVTGGSSGLGLAMARHLSGEGAIVYAVSRHGKANDNEQEPEGLIHIACDVTDYQGMADLMEQIASKGSLDFLVNNAGITIKKRAEEIKIEELLRIQEINVNAPYLLSCLAYPYLKQSKHTGRIINIASMAAHLGFSEVVPYCMSKAAILGLTRGLAVEWREDNVVVNSISPGWFPSEMTKNVMDKEREQKIINKIALGHFGNPQDIANMACFLLSDKASYINGQDFAVDGGALIYGY